MRRNKAGLADLKKLRQEAQSPDPTPAPAKAQRPARKRAPFLPPSPSPSVGAQSGAGRKPGLPPQAGPQASDSAQAQTSRPPALQGADSAGIQLSEADRRLFRTAVRYVERIKDPGRVLLAPVSVAQDSILKERRMRAAGLENAKPAKRPQAQDEAGPKPHESDRKPRPERRPRPLSDDYASAAHDHDDSRYLKAGHGTDILKDLKRGKWAIGASLDLHGSTLEDARERFERFLSSCLTHDVKCVRIVHGKGYGSRNGDAVLKTTVRRWLTQIAEVIAYTECSEADGGSGAVQVLLK